MANLFGNELSKKMLMKRVDHITKHQNAKDQTAV